DAQEEQDREEEPVADHVAGAVLLLVGAPVVEPERLADPLDDEDEQAGEEREAEDVEEERVAEVEGAAEVVEAEDRLREIVLEAEDDGAGEEDGEAVEDRGVREAGDAVAPLDPGVREHDQRHPPDP